MCKEEINRLLPMSLIVYVVSHYMEVIYVELRKQWSYVWTQKIYIG